MKRIFSLTLTISLLLLTNVRVARAEDGGGADTAIPFTVPFNGDYGLDIECVSEAAQLYFLWDEAPGSWTLTATGDSGVEMVYECGEYGFLHEYVRLDSPAAKFKLTFPYGGIKGSVYAFSEGEPPDWVERWGPPREKADLLVLPERPEDEYLYFGGTLPYYAGKGKNIQVAYALSGDDDKTDLCGLLNALYGVGVRTYPVIAYLDDDDDNGDARTAFYVELIRRCKPEVVLGQYSDANQSAMAAIDASGKEGQYPESEDAYGVWDVPKAYLHGFIGGEIIMDWDAPAGKPGGKTAAGAAREAFFAQFPESPATNDRGFIRLRGSDRFGLYRSAFGADLLGGDFFENTSQAVPPKLTREGPGPTGSKETAPTEPASSVAVGEGFMETNAERANAGRNHVFLPILGGAAVLCLVLAFFLRARQDI